MFVFLNKSIFHENFINCNLNISNAELNRSYTKESFQFYVLVYLNDWNLNIHYASIIFMEFTWLLTEVTGVI